MDLKKEMILAIVIGLILGVGAALFISKTPQKLFNPKKEEPPSPPVEESILPPPVGKTEDFSNELEVLLPQDQALVSESEVAVSGKTKPNQTVLITTPFSENAAISSSDGTFSGKVKLEEGANEIKVLAVSEDGFEEKTLIVNYTKEPL